MEKCVETMHNCMHNVNNTMSLKLIAKSILIDHIVRFVNKGSDSTSCLSHIICDEFILLMMEKLMYNIIKEFKKSKYFSISTYRFDARYFLY